MCLPIPLTHTTKTGIELAALPFRKRLDAGRTAPANFFRRMIPLPGLTRGPVDGAPYEIVPQSLANFEPGTSLTLDCVCRGVLKGSPFVLDKGW
jgi:hypothetical protein